MQLQSRTHSALFCIAQSNVHHFHPKTHYAYLVYPLFLLSPFAHQKERLQLCVREVDWHLILPPLWQRNLN